MPTLRLLPTAGKSAGHGGEVFGCTYTVDGRSVLSAGWDGHLRLWDAATGTAVLALRASSKPLTACAVSPEGASWLSGSLDGLLSHWEPGSQRLLHSFTPHGQPLSAIVYSPDRQTLATASWDGNIILWDPKQARENRTLAGHRDVVSGCRFTPFGERLLSWSYDGTVRLWDTARFEERIAFTSHTDRVLAGAVSPDGRWAASGSRDGDLRLYDLALEKEIACHPLGSEIRACLFLLDAAVLVAIDASGRLTLHALPDLALRGELATPTPVQCAALSPSGAQLALGGEDGLVRFAAVEGFDAVPLVTLALPRTRRTATAFQKLLGRSSVVALSSWSCPVCGRAAEDEEPPEVVSCPGCGRKLRLAAPPGPARPPA